MAIVQGVVVFREFDANTYLWSPANANLRAVLLKSTSTYTKNRDHSYMSELLAGGCVEATTPVASRIALTGVTMAYQAASNITLYDCDDPEWVNLEAGESANAVVFINDTGNDATSKALFMDAFSPVAGAGQPFTYVVNANGIVRSYQG